MRGGISICADADGAGQCAVKHDCQSPVYPIILTIIAK